MTAKRIRTTRRPLKAPRDREFFTCSPEETVKLGVRFARKLKKGDTVALTGGLGCGKTTFVQGILDSLGIKKYAKSASFVLVNEYSAGDKKLLHMDLYRLRGRDINTLGMEDYIMDGAITVIEWADKLDNRILRPSYNVNFKWLGERKRKISIRTEKAAK